MPIRYDCESCKLTFMVGRFHLHDLYGEYSAASCLVCWGCGLQYSMTFANPDRGPEFFEQYGIEVSGIGKGATKVVLMKFMVAWFGCTIKEAMEKANQFPFVLEKDIENPDENVKTMVKCGILAKKVLIHKNPNPNFGKPLARDVLEKYSQLQFVDSSEDDITLTVIKREVVK